MQKVKLWFARTFYVLALYWWINWSKVYRFFFNRNLKSVIIPPYLNPIDAYITVMKLSYKKDTWKQLWDVCSSPYYVQENINHKLIYGKQLDGPMDCDEYAVWCAYALSAIKFKTYIMSVGYIRPEDKKIGGHAICVFFNEEDKKYYHIGNWGYFGPFDVLEDIPKHILSVKKTDKLVGWALFSKDLRLLKHKRG